jgi:hypothetical protein
VVSVQEGGIVWGQVEGVLEGKVKMGEKEWMSKGRKNSWEEDQWIVVQQKEGK